MRQECLYIVKRMTNHEISDRAGERILQDIRDMHAVLENKNPELWASMSQDDRLAASLHEVVERLKKMDETVTQRGMEQAAAELGLQIKMADLEGKGKRSFEAVGSVLDAVDKYGASVLRESARNLEKLFPNFKGYFFGLAASKEERNRFVHEVYGESTGSETAKDAAKAWLSTAEALRLRANNSGADIGKLSYSYLPQSHDWWKIRRANKDKWISDTLPLLNRERYKHDDGRLYDSRELSMMLEDVYFNIITNGSPDADLGTIAEKVLSQQQREGRKHSDHRQLHFKDADSWITYADKYGSKELVSELNSHVSRMSTIIALLEKMGPYPYQSYKMLHDMAEKTAKNARATESRWDLAIKYSDHHGITGVDTDAMWNVLTGYANTTATNMEWLATPTAALRNLEAAGMLGQATIASLGDAATYFTTTRFNNLGLLSGIKWLFRALDKDWRQYAKQMGIIGDALLNNMNRFASDYNSRGVSGLMSQATMRLTLLEDFTDWIRRAFSLNMMAGLARMKKTPWNELHPDDRTRLTEAGFTESDWMLINQAGVETCKGIDFLTMRSVTEMMGREDIRDIDGSILTDKQAIKELANMIQGFVIHEAEIASPAPGLQQRAEITRGLQKGTAGGELARCAMLFKAFPITVMEQHLERMAMMWAKMGKTDAFGYLATLTVFSALIGGAICQIKNLLNGRDLQDDRSPEFWAKALALGGGWGWVGDAVSGMANNDGRGITTSDILMVLGPWSSDLKRSIDLTTGAENRGETAVRMFSDHVPLLRWWYLKTLFDRAIMNDLIDYFNEGRTERINNWRERATGQRDWISERRLPQKAEEPKPDDQKWPGRTGSGGNKVPLGAPLGRAY